MKKLRLLLAVLALGTYTSQVMGQDVEFDFSWVSATPTTSSTLPFNVCGTSNTLTITTDVEHVVEGVDANMILFPGVFSFDDSFPISIDFGQPVCNLSISILGLDYFGGGPPREYITFDPVFPVGISSSGLGPMIIYTPGLVEPEPAVSSSKGWIHWDGLTSGVSMTFNRDGFGGLLFDSISFDCSCPPTNLECCEGNDWQMLSWDDVDAAVEYHIEFGFNDYVNGCCDSTGVFPTGWMEIVTDNYFVVPETFADCFSWRVRYETADGSLSEWSEWSCDCFDDGTPTECVAPINLDCEIDPFSGEKTLSWDAVVGALGYEVSITYNDPSCCSVPGTVTTTTVSTTSTYISGIGPNECFSWKVRTICSDDPTYSDWSESKCSNDCAFPETSPVRDPVDKLDEEIKLPASPPSLDVDIIPNPAKDFVTIKLSNLDSKLTYRNLQMTITDANGRIVYRADLSTSQPHLIDLKDFAPGMYLYTIRNNDAILNSNKLIVE